jgi:splicing factor 3B subunit 5
MSSAPPTAGGSTGGSDRANVNLSFSRNWEHLASKFVGTGNPEMSRHAWATSVARDSLASHLGHADQVALFALVEGEAQGRTRYTMLERMLQPCGAPPQETPAGAAGAGASAAAAPAAAAAAAAAQ